jgi:hypothetical protein
MSFSLHSRYRPVVWAVTGVTAQHEMLGDRLPPKGRSGLSPARNMR